MRKLMLMRHAKADDQYEGSDLSRPLTEEGVAIQNEVVKHLKDKSIEIDAIIYSPYKRAHDSALIVQENYPEAFFYKEPALGTVFDSYTVLRYLKKKKFNNVLVVGHAPTLSAFALSLLKDPKPLEFDKSGLAIFDFKDHIEFGQGHLSFFLSPSSTL